ncbi:MAG: hypothetical protein RL094_217 [Candidatus Parcubacteria bacterium]|jgi:hypothetical protein
MTANPNQYDTSEEPDLRSGSSFLTPLGLLIVIAIGVLIWAFTRPPTPKDGVVYGVSKVTIDNKVVLKELQYPTSYKPFTGHVVTLEKAFFDPTNWEDITKQPDKAFVFFYHGGSSDLQTAAVTYDPAEAAAYALGPQGSMTGTEFQLWAADPLNKEKREN